MPNLLNKSQIAIIRWVSDTSLMNRIIRALFALLLQYTYCNRVWSGLKKSCKYYLHILRKYVRIYAWVDRNWFFSVGFFSWGSFFFYFVYPIGKGCRASFLPIQNWWAIRKSILICSIRPFRIQYPQEDNLGCCWSKWEK